MQALTGARMLKCAVQLGRVVQIINISFASALIARFATHASSTYARQSMIDRFFHLSCRTVQALGGEGVLVGAPSSAGVVQMDCAGAQCDLDLTIPAAMIAPAAASAMQVPACCWHRTELAA